MNTTISNTERKIRLKARNVAKILIRDEKFIFNYLKPFLLNYISNINEYFDNNKEKIQKLNKIINLSKGNKTLTGEANKAFLFHKKLSFLVKVVGGFDIKDAKILKDFLQKNFKTVEKEHLKQFLAELDETSEFFSDLHNEETKEIISYKSLYKKAKYLVNFVLDEEIKLTSLEMFIYEDLKNNIIKEVKDSNDLILDNLMG